MPMLSKQQIAVTATMELTQAQMMALSAVFAYGEKSILDHIRATMGGSYQFHALALESFLRELNQGITPILWQLEQARKAFDMKNAAIVDRDELDRLRKNQKPAT